MSIKYLNLSGLEDLWINIKNYILSKIPTKTSELTNDSGYLTSHQSLDNYVTLNSNQTITAIKTITGGNQGKMLFKNPNYTKGDAVESGTTISRLYFGNGTSYGAANGVLTTDISSAGNTSIELCAMNNTASSSYRASLIITYDKSATSPRLLKSWGNFVPYSSDNYTLGNSSSIWKECYCNAYYLGTTAFGDIVTHNASEFLTSHQSLSSCVKNVVTNSQTIKSTGITRGTAPSSAQTFGLGFSDNNNKYIGNVYGVFATDKSTYVGLYAYKGTTTANGDNASVRVGYDASGNAYTYAPTPATADNSTQIATTAFVKAQGYLTSHQSLANYVTTNTDQTISGVKSFSDNISTKKIISNVAQLQINARSSADSVAIIAGANASDGSGIWLYGKDNATGSDCRIQIYNTTKSRYERVDLVGSQFLPNPSGELDCGGTSNKWKSVYATNYYYGNDNVEFSTKFVTTDTDQSISGIKSHSKHISILGDYVGNESSTNGRSCLYLKANRDTDGKSGLYVTKFRQNRAQGSMGNSDTVFLSHDILENETRTNAGFVESYSNWANDVPGGMSIYSTIATRNLGTSAKPWTNAYITNLNLNGNAFDPTSIDGVGTTKLLAYEPASASDYGSTLAGTTKPGSSLYDVSMDLLNATGYYGDFNSGSGEFIVSINARNPQSGTWKILHNISVSAPQSGARSFAISMWVRIA